MNPLKILKNRSDIGAGTRGSDMGIDALEIAAINSGNDFFNRHPYLDIPSHNETIYNKVKNTTAKRINFVVEQCERLKIATKQALDQGFFPVILSGDHSSALGSLAGIKAKYPKQKMGVIWIDAHADLHTPLSSPSGNIHGMPLAAALGHDNQSQKINKVSPETLLDWNQMKNMGSISPMLLPENLIYFGVRDTEAQEDEIIDQCGIRNYKVNELRNRSIDVCIAEALKQLESVDVIYITFDVDALDCDLISKGTGTPVSKGFDTQEVINLIQGFFASEKVIALEVSEINPLLDNKCNQMAEAAFDVIKTVF